MDDGGVASGEPAPAGKGCNGLVVLMAIGAAVVAAGMLLGIFGVSSYFWPTAEGRIVRQDTERRAAGRTSYPVWVAEYEYEAGGTTYRNDQYSFGDDVWVDFPKTGATVQVRYFPLRPSTSVVRPGISDASLILLFFGGILLLLGWAPMGMSKDRRAVRAQRRAAKRAARARRSD